jgi:large subunit ribosomal protein L4
MQVTIKDLKGADAGTLELNDAVFAQPMNRALVYQALVRQRANARQGTSDTKTRKEVSGSDKKLWAQKHTGRARMGDKRSPIWRHGGIVFGPHPRGYEQDLPKKMRRQAIRCMLSDKQRGGDLIVLKDMDLAGGKTKEMAEVLKGLDTGGSTLLVTAAADPKVVKAAHNIDGVWTLPASQLNVGDLAKYQRLVMTVDAVKAAEALWAQDGPRKRAGKTGEVAA